MTDREVDLACLAQLPMATPHRLRRLLADQSPELAWQQVLAGAVGSGVAPAKVRAEWHSAAPVSDREFVASVLERLSISVSCVHDPAHPTRLRGDIDPAPILFRLGDTPDEGLPRVAVIGTRRCSPVGREVAYELGRGLASNGVVVVSGLALGIDGAAHRGALSIHGAPPVAVVGSGPDVVYPTRHADLWNLMAAQGAIFSEAHIGARPEPWRFPARNRLLAAMSDLVVVVESRAAGGSLLTVEQAIRRDVSVMAVPGSVRNRAADGTNQLIADGCQPVRDADDIIIALGLRSAFAAARRTECSASEPPPAGVAVPVIDCVDDGPTTLDEIAQRCSLPVSRVLSELELLITRGLVGRDGARYIRSAGSVGGEGRQMMLGGW